MFCINNEKRKKESSLILRKAKFQAIFKFVLSSASGGAGGGKYNRIPAFVSMSVLLIGRSLEKFFQKNFRDDSSFYGFAKVKILSFLSRCCASANQGISTTALCREAHKRRFIFNSWILHFIFAPFRMTILALLFTIATTAESWATTISCLNGVREDGITTCEKCGNNCNWKIENGTLTISGSGAMKDYKNTGHDTYIHPWDNLIETITSVKVDGVNTVGKGALANLVNVTNLEIGETVTSIGQDGFKYERPTTLTLPDSVQNIGAGAFSIGDHSLARTIIISDSLKTIDIVAFGYNFDCEIVCRGNIQKCQDLVKNYAYWNNDRLAYIDLSGNVVAATDEQCNSVNYYYTGSECSRRPTDGSDITCTNGYKKSGNNCINCTAAGKIEWQGQCYDEYPFSKKHWTPAEAAQWLHDGNDNFVVITFKK